jgi:hypothetical protein
MMPPPRRENRGKHHDTTSAVRFIAPLAGASRKRWSGPQEGARKRRPQALPACRYPLTSQVPLATSAGLRSPAAARRTASPCQECERAILGRFRMLRDGTSRALLSLALLLFSVFCGSLLTQVLPAKDAVVGVADRHAWDTRHVDGLELVTSICEAATVPTDALSGACEPSALPPAESLRVRNVARSEFSSAAASRKLLRRFLRARDPDPFLS